MPATPGIKRVHRTNISANEQVHFTESDVQVITTWVVTTSDKEFDPVNLTGCTDGTRTLPLPYSRHPVAIWLVATDYLVRRNTESPFDWDIQFTYTPPKFSKPPEDRSGKWNIDVEIDGAVTVEEGNAAIDTDDEAGNVTWNGKVVNSARQLASHKIPREIYDEQITVSFDTGVIDQSNIQACRGRTNSEEITLNVPGNGSESYTRTFPPYSLKLIKVTQKTTVNLYSTDTTTGISDPFWSMEYVFIYRDLTLWPCGFNAQIVDIGLFQKDPSDSTKIKPSNVDTFGNLTGTEVFLDGHGVKSTSASAVLVPPMLAGSPAAGDYTAPNGLDGYQICPSADFTGLFTGLT